jgi:murein DD-endopeptidase MepM/ murein hydrolase activator NlpD
MPFSNRYCLGLVALALVAGCGADQPGASGSTAGLSSTGTTDPVQASAPTQTLPPDPSGWRLPWSCGVTLPVNQGNNGDQCGVIGDHIGIQDYAWDFGLPMRTPVLASRPGIVTFAATYSPPGSECHSGCPYAWGSDDEILCCARCLYSANRVNVEHDDKTISSYSHFDEVVVQVGQHVEAGDLLGYSGTSGCSTGPHLHFQVMTGCSTGYCQSVPVSFDEAGVPACGDQVTSQNACN